MKSAHQHAPEVSGPTNCKRGPDSGPGVHVLLARPRARASDHAGYREELGTVCFGWPHLRLPAASACMHALAEHCIGWLGRLVPTKSRRTKVSRSLFISLCPMTQTKRHSFSNFKNTLILFFCDRNGIILHSRAQYKPILQGSP